MESFRETLEGTLRATREDSGLHLEYLHLGPPATADELAAAESALGYPMDASLRALFEEANGLQVCYWREPSRKAAWDDALIPATAGPLSWSEASHAFGRLWGKIEAAGAQPSIVCIPALKTIFETPWSDIHGMEEGVFLFDAFHHYKGVYLRADRKAKRSLIGVSTDHWAAYDHEPVPVEDYLSELQLNWGNGRRFTLYGQDDYV